MRCWPPPCDSFSQSSLTFITNQSKQLNSCCLFGSTSTAEATKKPTMDKTAYYSSRSPSSPSTLSWYGNSNECQWFGMKRGRDGQPLVAATHPPSHFVISQEEDYDEEEDEQTSYDDIDDSDDRTMQDVVMSGPFKRARLSYSTSATTSFQQHHPHHIPDVTIPTNQMIGGNFGKLSNAMPVDSSTLKKKTNNTACVPWWKQTKKSPVVAPVGTCSKGVCCVCEEEFDPNSATMSRGNNMMDSPDVMPANALLAYFTPVQKAQRDNSRGKARSTHSTPRSPHKTENSSSRSFTCTFCERMACSKCLVNCDGCQKSFCKFCVNKDYSEVYERTLCGDCCCRHQQHHITTATSNAAGMSHGDGDSMTMMMEY